jgi:hypothetical protein
MIKTVSSGQEKKRIRAVGSGKKKLLSDIRREAYQFKASNKNNSISNVRETLNSRR